MNISSTNKLIYPLAFILALVSGIVNIYGLMTFGLVFTNATGHFSNLVLEANNFSTTTGYILCYFGGALWGYFCFKRYPKIAIDAVSFLNISILLGMVFIQNFPLGFMLFAMSSHNAFGASLSEGIVRPSQITGVIINLAEDVANYVNGKKCGTVIVTRLLNMAGFVLGGALAFRYNHIEILYPIIAFYIVFIFLNYKWKTTT